MKTFMWRMLRIALLYASCATSLSPLLAYVPLATWVVIVLVPTALADVWLESIKGK